MKKEIILLNKRRLYNMGCEYIIDNELEWEFKFDYNYKQHINDEILNNFEIDNESFSQNFDENNSDED
jgi:hypothetical protein